MLPLRSKVFKLERDVKGIHNLRGKIKMSQNYDSNGRGVTRRDFVKYLAASVAATATGCNVFGSHVPKYSPADPSGFEATLVENANTIFGVAWRERHKPQLDLIVDAELRAVRRGSLGRKVTRLSDGQYAFIGVDLPKDERSGEYLSLDSNEWTNFVNAHLLDPRYTWNGTGHRSFGASLVQNDDKALVLDPQVYRAVMKQVGEENVVGLRSGVRAKELEPIVEDVYGQRRMIVLAGDDYDRTNLVGIFDTRKLYELYRERELAAQQKHPRGMKVDDVDAKIYAIVDDFATRFKQLFLENDQLRKNVLETIANQQELRKLGVDLQLSKLPRSELYVFDFREGMPSDYLHKKVVQKANDEKLDGMRFDLLADETLRVSNIYLTDNGRFDLQKATKGKREVAVLGHTKALERAGVPSERMFPDLTGEPLKTAVDSNRYLVAVVDETEWRKSEETLWKKHKPRRISEHPPKVKTPK